MSYRIDLPVKYQVHNIFRSIVLRSFYENDSVMFSNRTVINVQPPALKSVNKDEEDEGDREVD